MENESLVGLVYYSACYCAIVQMLLVLWVLANLKIIKTFYSSGFIIGNRQSISFRNPKYDIIHMIIIMIIWLCFKQITIVDVFAWWGHWQISPVRPHPRINVTCHKTWLRLSRGSGTLYWIIWNGHQYGALARYVKLRLRMRRECRERFPRHRW